MNLGTPITKFSDLPGWAAEPVGEGEFWIWDTFTRVAQYNSETRAATLLATHWSHAEFNECHNLHQAMRWAFLKLQKPL